MITIGGNITAELQLKNITKNAFGEQHNTYETVQTLTGYIDYTGGNAEYKTTYKGKLEETTHVFLCDYVDIPEKDEMYRMIINNQCYDVILIDNPMNLNQQLEIFLKCNGAVK